MIFVSIGNIFVFIIILLKKEYVWLIFIVLELLFIYSILFYYILRFEIS